VANLKRIHGGDPVLVATVAGGVRRIPTPDPAGALTRLVAEARVEDFHVERADLEQVFLKLTGRKLRDE
jgi:hypothetical protein